MITKLLISHDLQSRLSEVDKILAQENLSLNHPDVLIFSDEQKLGVEEAKKIREHLSLKPYSAKGRAVIIVSSHNLSHPAQNSLLKTLEEPPEDALLILGSKDESDLLPTILSRCQIVFLDSESKESSKAFFEDIDKLMNSSIEERFEYIEKLEQKEDFLNALASYSSQNLKNKRQVLGLAKKVLKAQEWNSSNVNVRAILEYLMLNLNKEGR